MTITPYTVLLALAAMIAGGVAGHLHIASLSRVTRLLVQGKLIAVPLQLGRFVLLAAFLWLCSHGGAATLLAGSAGVIAGRQLLLRQVG